jgi:hypothetical protein
MRTWLALLVAPSLALACQSAMYALVTPSCSMQTRVVIHVVAFGALALAALFTLMALAQWRRASLATPHGPDSDGADRRTSRGFLAAVAAAVGTISCLVIFAMWITVWVLSPCWQ